MQAEHRKRHRDDEAQHTPRRRYQPGSQFGVRVVLDDPWWCEVLHRAETCPIRALSSTALSDRNAAGRANDHREKCTKAEVRSSLFRAKVGANGKALIQARACAVGKPEAWPRTSLHPDIVQRAERQHGAERCGAAQRNDSKENGQRKTKPRP